MAAPLKKGIDYFPLVVNFFEKDKIKLLRARHGGDRAVIVILRLLCKIYEHGFYYKIGQNEILLLMLDMAGDFSAEYIQGVIESAVELDFFNKSLYEKSSVLTSKEIQENYVEATARRKNKDYLGDPFWLVTSQKTPQNPINANIIGVNVDTNPDNDNKNKQSKVEESKIDKSNKNTFAAPSLIDVENYFIQNKALNALDAKYWAERFVNFYEMKDWFVGKTKMKKWHSAASNALLTWGDSRNQKTQQTQQSNENRPNSIRI